MEDQKIREEYNVQLLDGFDIDAVTGAMWFVVLALVFRKLTRLYRLLYLGRISKFKYWRKLKKFLKKLAKLVENMIN
jgi:hypothetical protein